MLAAPLALPKALCVRDVGALSGLCSQPEHTALFCVPAVHASVLIAVRALFCQATSLSPSWVPQVTPHCLPT